MVNTKKTNKIILITSIIISFVVLSSSFFMEWESYRQIQKRSRHVLLEKDIFDTLQDDDSHKKEAPQGVEKFLVPKKQVPEELNKRGQHKVAPPKGLTLKEKEISGRFVEVKEFPKGFTILEDKEPSWWHRAIKTGISNAVIGFLIAFCGLLGIMRLPKIIDNAIPKIMNYTKNKGSRRANLALGIIAIVPGFLWGISNCPSGFRRVPIEECIGMGIVGAIIFFLGTLFGVWGIIYLASWVYEGFKEEKSPPGKKSPTIRKKSQ